MIRKGFRLTIQPKDKFYFKKKNAQKEHEKQRPVLRFTLIFILFSVLLVYYVWQQIEVNQIAVEINQLEERRNQLINVNEQLRLDIDKQLNFDLITQFAREELEMVFPETSPEEILTELPEQPKGILKTSGDYLIGKVFGADK